jgi:hypothetical protein
MRQRLAVRRLLCARVIAADQHAREGRRESQKRLRRQQEREKGILYKKSYFCVILNPCFFAVDFVWGRPTALVRSRDD